MIQPARYDIAADRWVACLRTLSFLGLDLTGGTFLSHVRLTPDAGGSPIVALSNVSSSAAEGVSILYAGSLSVAGHIAAGRMTAEQTTLAGLVAADVVAMSVLTLRLNETTMEALPFPAERGDDITLVWDIHITPSGGIKDKYAGGKFVVRAGATQ